MTTLTGCELANREWWPLHENCISVNGLYFYWTEAAKTRPTLAKSCIMYWSYGQRLFSENQGTRCEVTRGQKVAASHFVVGHSVGKTIGLLILLILKMQAPVSGTKPDFTLFTLLEFVFPQAEETGAGCYSTTTCYLY